MKYSVYSSIVAAAMASVMNAAAASDGLPVPPSISETPDNVSNPDFDKGTPQQRAAEKIRRAESSSVQVKELTAEEEAKIKKDMDEAKIRSKDPSFWPKTKIVETVDNRGQVTAVTVTPGSTQIPYTMTRKNPSNKSSSEGEGTLGVPKFINFGF